VKFREEAKQLHGAKKFVAAVLFCIICVLINFIGSQIAAMTGLPLYFDCLGTILAGVFGGYIPGIVVGYATNLLTSVSDPTSVYWSLTSVLIAVFATFLSRRGWFEKPLTGFRLARLETFLHAQGIRYDQEASCIYIGKDLHGIARGCSVQSCFQLLNLRVKCGYTLAFQIFQYK